MGRGRDGLVELAAHDDSPDRNGKGECAGDDPSRCDSRAEGNHEYQREQGDPAEAGCDEQDEDLGG